MDVGTAGDGAGCLVRRPAPLSFLIDHELGFSNRHLVCSERDESSGFTLANICNMLQYPPVNDASALR